MNGSSIEVRDGRPAYQAEHAVNFRAQNLQNRDDSILATNREAPVVRSTDKASARTNRDGPYDIATTPYPSVQVDFSATTRSGFQDFGQRIDARGISIEISSTVVRTHHCV